MKNFVNLKSPKKSSTARKKKTSPIHSKRLPFNRKKGVSRPLNLKLQIIVGFVIPIFIVIFVGISAYSEAESGLIDTYETATFNSMEMASQLIDYGLENISSTALEITSLPDFLTCISEPDGTNTPQAVNDLKSSLLMKQLASDFIKKIHMIPNNTCNTISTANAEGITGVEVYQKARKDDFDAQCMAITKDKRWGSSHPIYDDMVKIADDSYAGYLCAETSYTGTVALVVIDINSDKIRDILSQISLGENSIIAYHTLEGKEITVGSDSFVFSDKEYVQNAIASGEPSGKAYVTENSVEYLYMYDTCSTNGAIISALVPKSVITAQADSIRTSVIIYIALACVIVGIIGIAILYGLQKNLKIITSGLVKASKGDLTVTLNIEGKSEFAALAKHVMETVRNTKNLIASVQNTTYDVSNSSENVGKVSDVISTSSEAISDALEEINGGVNQEADEAQECLSKMDALSEKILRTSEKIGEVETLADATKQMAQEGSLSMESLIEHSFETAEITATVNEKVNKLIEHSMQIEAFVKNINDIADQTTLLSLNASIEAARAGESGRGFTVVAGEIKKLSEHSMESVKAIEELVREIHVMTDDTKVATAKSQAIVEDQQEKVAAAKQMFLDVNQMIEQLLDNMRQVATELEGMDVDRSDTLNSIQNISGVIEETLASTTLVSDRLKEQVSIMDGLTNATSQLNSNTHELNHAVGKFTV